MNIDSGNRGDSDQMPATEVARVDVRHMSAEQLGALGMSHIAYVKPVVINGQAGFAIHAADGTPMAMTADRNLAVAVIVQHEMHPLSVH